MLGLAVNRAVEIPKVGEMDRGKIHVPCPSGELETVHTYIYVIHVSLGCAG